jgi:hypothetical protein
LGEEKSSPEAWFEEIEKDTSTLRWFHQRAAKLAEIERRYVSAGDHKRAEQLQWEISIFYKPPMTLRDHPRDQSTTPWNEQLILPNKALDYLETRVRKTPNPIHRSLYADVLWGKKRGHEYAEAAIDSYLECADIYLQNGWDIEMVASLDRAAELSMTLNNHEKINTTCRKIMQILEALTKKQAFRWSLEISDILLRMRVCVNEDALEKAMTILRLGSDDYRKSGNLHLHRSFLDMLAEYSKCLRRYDQARTYRVEIADSYDREGDARMKQSGLTACVSYQSALSEYRTLGEKKKVEDLLIKLKTAGEKAATEMHPVEVIVKRPEPFRQLAERFLTAAPGEALQMIAVSDALLPSLHVARGLTENLKKEYPLSYIVPTQHFRHADPVSKSLDESSIAEDHVIDNFSLDYQLKMIEFAEILDRLKEKGLDSAMLIQQLSKSDLFTKDSLSIIRVGFDRFLEGDYVSAVHVLTPKLEATLRRLLGKLGKPTTKFKGDIVIEQPIDDILRNGEIVSFLGQDIVCYMRTFLADKRGQNLRHEIAHGLADLEDCSQRNAATLVHQLLILTRFPSI